MNSHIAESRFSLLSAESIFMINIHGGNLTLHGTEIAAANAVDIGTTIAYIRARCAASAPHAWQNERSRGAAKSSLSQQQKLMPTPLLVG